MLGKQASDERLYPKIEDKGRGLKSMRDVYNETRLWWKGGSKLPGEGKR